MSQIEAIIPHVIAARKIYSNSKERMEMVALDHFY